MKYAFTSFSCPSLPLGEALNLVASCGYSGFEPRLDRGHGHGIEISLNAQSREDVRRQCEDAGVAICCLSISHQFADPAVRAGTLKSLPRYLELAADLRCPVLRVFGGPLPENLPRGAAIEGVAEALRTVGNEAAEFGVDIAVETHDDWCSAADLAAVMTLAEHPNVGVNWDVTHPVLFHGYSLSKSFALLQRWIRHVHIHDAMVDGFSKGAPFPFREIGKGQVDHAEVLELLFSSQYTGFLSGEWIDWGSEDQLRSDLRTLRELEMEAGITSL